MTPKTTPATNSSTTSDCMTVPAHVVAQVETAIREITKELERLKRLVRKP
jgi:hypothetical protein